MAKVARMSSTSCPCCDTEVDVELIHGAPGLGMVPINLNVCDCCGHLMMVERNLTLRELTTEEFRAVINHPTVVAEQRRWVTT
jgi:hypothetical protein